MKKYFFVLLFIPAAFLLYIVYLGVSEEYNNRHPYNEHKYDVVKMEAFRQQIKDTKNKGQDVNLPEGITLEMLADDLMKHKELIPFKGVLGGTPYYFSIFFFDDYVFAYATDGHIGADMVLSYTITKEGEIKWLLVAYDKSSG
jgi:hypothetical protein